MSVNLHPGSEPIGGRIAVLGGLGFMGSHICRELSARGCAVRIFDRLYASHELIRDFERDVEVVSGDISRKRDVLSAIADADVLIHLVHTTVPGSSMDDPEYDITSNVIASVRWLRHLGETKIRSILYFSSGGTVYGIPQTNPISESHQTNPISSYGITKLAIEKYVAMYASMFGIEYRLIRPSNVYGAGQRLHIGQGVIGVTAERALRGKPLELWGTGESLRDYLHVEDMTAAAVALLGYRGPHRIFNVSSGRGCSILDIIAILHDQLGSLPEIIRKPARSFDVPVNVLDSSRLHAETGWRPKVGLEEGIIRTIAWLKTLRGGKDSG
ncbi:MAG TPA: NAD-dependent epimerase/dehydratase family protein [Pyrinomonadaceae bacterium]|nr:NAD-dependent epimerase/dehydratase family protein [Pyrinomonadaceae bacterium]